MSDLISTGNQGLDLVLRGGLAPNRLYLLEGSPGTGKTTLALQFLLDGVSRGERTLYITLSESREELESVAQSHGFDATGMDIFEMSALEAAFDEGRDQSILQPWEAELGEMVRHIQDQVDAASAKRVVFDSLSEIRLLAQDPLRFRRQVLALKQFFTSRQITVILLDDLSGSDYGGVSNLHNISHGVIGLEVLTLDFGAARRRLQVHKMRGSDFIGGWHDFTIRKGGIDVFPRLIAANHHATFDGKPVSSGIAELDALMAGGPPRGTSTLIIGPPAPVKPRSDCSTYPLPASAANGASSMSSTSGSARCWRARILSAWPSRSTSTMVCWKFTKSILRNSRRVNSLHASVSRSKIAVAAWSSSTA